MAYASRTFRGYLTGINTIITTGNVEIGSGSASTAVLKIPNGTNASPSIQLHATATTGLMSPDGTALDTTCSSSSRFRVNTEVAPLAAFVTASQERAQLDITPTTLTGDVTDYNPTSLSAATRLRIDPGAAGRTINSLDGGADGRRLRIINISATQTLSLLHDDGSTGTASMRFLCPNNVTLVIPVNGSRWIEYDSTSSRWRVDGSVA